MERRVTGRVLCHRAGARVQKEGDHPHVAGPGRLVQGGDAGDGAVGQIDARPARQQQRYEVLLTPPEPPPPGGRVA